MILITRMMDRRGGAGLGSRQLPMLGQERQERKALDGAGRRAQVGDVCRLGVRCDGPMGPGDGRAEACVRTVTSEFPFEFLRWKCPLHLPLNTLSKESDADASLL